MVAFHLTGDALSWYKYMFTNNLLTTWESFTRALEVRFGTSSYDNHQAALFKLRQTTTVVAYQTEFERLSNYVTGLLVDALLNRFISGLRSDIQQELSIQHPTTITQAIGIAKLIEDKLNDQRFRPRFSTPIRPPNPPNITPATTLQSPTTTTPIIGLLPTPPTPLNLPFTRLSSDALQKRRAAGLCFRCPEKYMLGHKCNPPHFLLIADNDEIDDEPPPNNTVVHQDVTQAQDHWFFSLSMAALFGLSSPQSLRITSYINNQPVTILIDCGSTHNIIQPRFVSFFKLPHDSTPEFSVMVGNGDHIKCIGICSDLVVHLNQTPFTIPFLFYQWRGLI